MEMTKCFIVVKDRDSKGEVKGFKSLKGEVELNKVLGAKKGQLVEIKMGNKPKKIYRENILLSKKSANRRVKERTIIHNFKEKNKGQWGWKCECCGTIFENIEDITVDHVVAKSSFKDESGKMTAEDWNTCWDESNLAILCVRCNQLKDNMDVSDFLEINSIATKQYMKHSKCPRGDKHKFRTLFQADEEIEVARRDSRIIDINTFFGKQPELMSKIAMSN